MDHEFWHNAWHNGRTAWRQTEPGSSLVTLWPRLKVPAGASVLVPLCGDSPDMRWLLDQGYQVIGCDLSELGLQRFVQQNGLTANRKAENGVVTLSAPGVTLFAADFLNLTEQQVGRPGAFFDRAATIALPPDLRTAYARQVAALMPTDANGLLISVDYNQDEMKGPPFSVPDADIQALYAPHFSIDSLVSDPNSDFLEHLKKRGITALTETAYQLTRTS